MSTTRYVTDETLPDSLALRIREKLDFKKQVITFKADTNAEQTNSELLINDITLVKKCREYLSTSASDSRNVYFRGTSTKRTENPKKAFAETLLKRGYSAQTVADVIGVSRITVCRWFKSGRSRGRPGHVVVAEATTKNLIRAMERLCELAKPFIDMDIFTKEDLHKSIERYSKQTGIPPHKIIRRASELSLALLEKD